MKRPAVLAAVLVCAATACDDPKIRDAVIDIVVDEVEKELERRADDEPAAAIEEERMSNRGNLAIESFSTSKRHLQDIHGGLHERTLYCGCSFDAGSKRIDLKSCGYEVRRNKERAQRVEFEHVVPASRFGRTFSAWVEGHASCVRKRKGKAREFKGRECAERASTPYKLMQADMHNLFPAVGEVNGDRSNDPYGEVAGEPREYGRCDVEFGGGVAEPAERARGEIARAMLYMAWAYPERVVLSDAERAWCERWSEKDPPERWEKERARKIEAIQGNPNPFVK